MRDARFTVWATGFSVAQTVISVAQVVKPAGYFRPSPRRVASICAATIVKIFYLSIHVFGHVCNNFWTMSICIALRRQRIGVAAGAATPIKPQYDNADNLSCCISCSGCRDSLVCGVLRAARRCTLAKPVHSCEGHLPHHSAKIRTFAPWHGAQRALPGGRDTRGGDARHA